MSNRSGNKDFYCLGKTARAWGSLGLWQKEGAKKQEYGVESRACLQGINHRQLAQSKLLETSKAREVSD